MLFNNKERRKKWSGKSVICECNQALYIGHSGRSLSNRIKERKEKKSMKDVRG